MIEDFITRLNQSPHTIEFEDTMAAVEAYYNYIPTGFKNGSIYNEPGTNEGSCKLFAFSMVNKLTEIQTLHCFGNYYRCDVLAHPNNTDHQNIRNFMQTGWQGIAFDKDALKPKN